MIAKRVILMLPTLVGICLLTSLFVRLLPGSAVELIAFDRATTPDVVRADLGLDKAWPVQFWDWATGVVRGDLGDSLITGKPVRDDLLSRLPVTLELILLAIVFGIAIALPIGALSAARQDSILDYLTRSVAVGAMAIPGFWLATLCVVWPARWWGWSPALQYTRIEDDPLANVSQLLLPSFLLGLGMAGPLMRMTRAMLLEVLRQDYVRTARSKGLSERATLFRHAFRNALIPVITVIGLQLPVLIGGAVIFEQIFRLPGLGQFMLEGLTRRDLPVIQGVVMVMAVVVVLSNLLVDLAYSYLDPRVRVS